MPFIDVIVTKTATASVALVCFAYVVKNIVIYSLKELKVPMTLILHLNEALTQQNYYLLFHVLCSLPVHLQNYCVKTGQLYFILQKFKKLYQTEEFFYLKLINFEVRSTKDGEYFHQIRRRLLL